VDVILSATELFATKLLEFEELLNRFFRLKAVKMTKRLHRINTRLVGLQELLLRGRTFGVVLAGCIAAVVCTQASAQLDGEPVSGNDGPVVSQAAPFIVSISDEETESERNVSGIVVGEGGAILTTSAILDGDEDLFVKFLGIDRVYKAVIDEVDKDLGVLLLRVAGGPSSEIAFFSKDEILQGAAIRVVFASGEDVTVAGEVTGAIGANIKPSIGGLAVSYWEHNALFPSNGFGGALVNECDEIIALNVIDPFVRSRRAQRRLEGPQQVAYGIDNSELQRLLAQWGVSPKFSVTNCKSAEEEVEEALQTVEAIEKELEDAQKRADDARKQAENAKRVAERQKEEVDRLRGDAEATEEERKDAEEAAQAAQNMARDAATAAAGFDTQISNLNIKLSTIQDQLTKEKEKRNYMLGGGLLALLAVGGLGVFFVAKRSGQLKTVDQQRAHAEAELSRVFPDIEFRGTDSSGNPHAFKITGSALLRSQDGVVVGRQPQAANVVLNHPEISRAHVRIKLVGEQVVVEDMDSTNGTKLNGNALTSGEPKPVQSGDEIALGALSFKVRFLDV
jgi:FHA domain